MAQGIRILIAATKAAAHPIITRLAPRYDPGAVKTVPPEALEEELGSDCWEALLWDCGCSERQPLSVLQLRDRLCPEMPVLFIAESMAAEAAVRLVKRGNCSLLFTDRLALLPQVLAQELEEARARRENREMRERLSKYQLLAERAKDAIFFVGRDGRILDVNDAALRLYGYTREELMAMTVFDIRRTPGTGIVVDQLDQADTEGVIFETAHYRKDGTP